MDNNLKRNAYFLFTIINLRISLSEKNGKVTIFLLGLMMVCIFVFRRSTNFIPSLSEIVTETIHNHTEDNDRSRHFFNKITPSQKDSADFLRRLQACNSQQSQDIFICYDSNGGVGNQMFQYASNFCFSTLNNFTLLVDETKDISKIFKLTATRVDPETYQKTCKNGEKMNNFVINKFNSRFLHFSCTRNITIHGYMQSYANFMECTAIVLKEFVFQNQSLIQLEAEKLIFKATNYTYSFQSKNRNNIILIAIHSRRGDYVGDWYPEAHPQYYKTAMEHFTLKYGSRCVFVVMTNSDNISRKWCNVSIVQNSSNTFLLDEASASIHLYILSHSDHVIISVGTYGWWGAFLNRNATVVKWNVFYKSQRYDYSEFYPSHWLIMEGDRLGNTNNEQRQMWGGM